MIRNTFREYWVSLKDSFKYIPPTLQLAWASSKRLTIFILALTFISAGFPMLIAYTGKMIIDAVVDHSVARAISLTQLEMVWVILQLVVLYATGLSRSLLGQRLANDVNYRVITHAASFPLNKFEDPVFYDQLTRARREASSRPVDMGGDILKLFQNIFILLGYASALVAFSPWAVLILMLSAIPATLAETKFSSSAFRIRNARSPDARRLGYLEYIVATDNHAKEVKAYGLGDHILKRYKALAERFYLEDKVFTIRRTLWAFFLSLFAIAAFYGCYIILTRQAATGVITVGLLTFYVLAFRQGQHSFQSCLQAIGKMYEHNLFMSNLFDFLNTEPEQSSVKPHRPKILPKPGILLNQVSFQYPNSHHWVFKDIDLHIPPGQILGLVGHNGAGKTTLIKLLCRLYDPTEGEIYLDGKDLRDWDTDELRLRFGIVFQDYNRYQFSIRENIELGNISDEIPESELMTAVQSGGTTDFLSELPHGLETQLGKWFSDGVELSGGQWQRVALSRAFLRQRADILILDEPTSNFDSIAEKNLFDRFLNVSKGKTAILISHRFPTVRLADRILVLNQGRIAEDGTHDLLVQNQGLYSEMFEAQAGGYR